MNKLCALTLSLTFALMQGCGSSSVADGVGQREANQIVAVLGEHGITATTEKGRGSKGRYSVLVPASHFGSAAALLSKLGLPAEHGATFEELMAPSGILPVSQEVEELRLDRAIASEIEELLLAHTGIASASVVVRYHSNPGGESPSVSIMAQTHGSGAVSSDQVREVVGRAVPGLKSSDISLVMTDRQHLGGETLAEQEVGLVPFLRFWSVPKGQYKGLAFLLIGLLIFVACLAALGGYIYGQFSASRGAEGPSAAPSENGSRGDGAMNRTEAERESDL